MKPARSYRNRTVAITGAAGGLGRALAQHFAAEGARVVVLDLDGAAAVRCAAELTAQGADALGLACDVTDDAACITAIAAACARYGGVDVLVANAGISARCLLRDTDAEVIRRVMAVNFFGAVHATQAALSSLRERHGQIVVISSVAGFAPLVGRTAYAASKHALHGFFDSLRGELAAAGIDVMLACPSFITTGIERSALGGDGRPATSARHTAGGSASPERVAARILRDARRRRRLCLPSLTSHLAWWLSRLAPRWYERQMLRRMGSEFDLSIRSSR